MISKNCKLSALRLEFQSFSRSLKHFFSHKCENNFGNKIPFLHGQGFKQRFVSSTGNMEALLSHIHSIVCDNDIGGLFLGCPKSCQMAAHNLQIRFNFLFMILHKKVSKMFRKVFSFIKKICFMNQNHEFLQSFTWFNKLFCLKKGDPNFF